MLCLWKMFWGITSAITGVQKQSEAALLHVRVDGVVSSNFVSFA
jgi:hypothetical protein